MATAKRVSAPPVETPPDTVVLELTLEEAQAIADVCGSIGGDMTESPRRHWESVEEALLHVGFTWRDSDPFESGLGLVYKDY